MHSMAKVSLVPYPIVPFDARLKSPVIFTDILQIKAFHLLNHSNIHVLITDIVLHAVY